MKRLQKKKIKKWFRENFYYYGREWIYKKIVPGIIIEKIIEPKNKSHIVPRDYRFFCFNGKPKFIALDIGTYVSKKTTDSGELISDRKRNLYDLQWNFIETVYKHPNFNEKINKPAELDKMIVLASKLSKNLKFTRIDFYFEEKIIFGEITFFPGNGMQPFHPKSYDIYFGDLLKL